MKQPRGFDKYISHGISHNLFTSESKQKSAMMTIKNKILRNFGGDVRLLLLIQLNVYVDDDKKTKNRKVVRSVARRWGVRSSRSSISRISKNDKIKMEGVKYNSWF